MERYSDVTAQTVGGQRGLSDPVQLSGTSGEPGISLS